MSGSELLARGRTADVYALDSERVLRRYRDGGDVSAEAAMMAYVGGLGFAVPWVEAAAGTDLVMERLDGVTLAEALVSGTLGVEAGARMLADLHASLHALPTQASDPATRILHLDLHPGNVVLSSRGPVVIDWRNAAEGQPAMDVALTALIMAEVAVDDSIGYAEQAALAVRYFLAHADIDISGVLSRMAAWRAADPCLSLPEVQRFPLAVALVEATVKESNDQDPTSEHVK